VAISATAATTQTPPASTTRGSIGDCRRDEAGVADVERRSAEFLSAGEFVSVGVSIDFAPLRVAGFAAVLADARFFAGFTSSSNFRNDGRRIVRSTDNRYFREPAFRGPFFARTPIPSS
jgi:hypothetical protein